MSVPIPLIITGISTTITLRLDVGGNFPNASGGQAWAAIVSVDNTEILVPAIELNEADTGSDWANSVFIFKVPGTATKALKYQGPAYIQLKTTLPEETSGFTECNIKRGGI